MQKEKPVRKLPFKARKKRSELRKFLVTVKVTKKERDWLSEQSRINGKTFSNWARAKLGLHEELYAQNDISAKP